MVRRLWSTSSKEPSGQSCSLTITEGRLAPPCEVSKKFSASPPSAELVAPFRPGALDEASLVEKRVEVGDRVDGDEPYEPTLALRSPEGSRSEARQPLREPRGHDRDRPVRYVVGGAAELPATLEEECLDAQADLAQL